MFLIRPKKKGDGKGRPVAPETAAERQERQRRYVEEQQRLHVAQQQEYTRAQGERLNRPVVRRGMPESTSSPTPTPSAHLQASLRASAPPHPSTPHGTHSQSQEEDELEKAMRLSLESHAEEERLRKQREEEALKQQMELIQRRERGERLSESTGSGTYVPNYDEPPNFEPLSASQQQYGSTPTSSQRASGRGMASVDGDFVDYDNYDADGRQMADYDDPNLEGVGEVRLRKKRTQRAPIPEDEEDDDANEGADVEEAPRTDWCDAKIRCKYVGTFDVAAGVPNKAGIKKGIVVMKEYLFGARPAFLLICLEGLKVIDSLTDNVAITHSISNVVMCTVVKKDSLFAFVGMDPDQDRQVCHVFLMESPKFAEHAHAWVTKAFKVAFCDLRRKQASQKKNAPAKRNSRVWAKYNANQGMGDFSAPSPHPQRTESGRDIPAPRSSQDTPQTTALVFHGDDDNDALTETEIVARRQSKTPKNIAENFEGIDIMMDDFEEFQMDDEDYLSNAPWFQAGIPREIAEEMLMMGEEGSFLVRDSMSNPGNFALTLKAQGKMHNFFIQASEEGYRILIGSGIVEPTFRDLGELILHYAENRGNLPVELSIDSINALAQEDESPYDDTSSFIDPEYERVHAF